jgi:hypothetical protein
MPFPAATERGLIFVHVPKTAGTTLRSILFRQYPPDDPHLFHFYDFPKDREAFHALPAERRQALRVLVGHIPFGYHAHLDAPADYITMLRDPVDLVTSLYYWTIRTRYDLLYWYASAVSFEDFVTSELPVVRELVRNLQTRYLSGVEGEATEETLALAKRNLETAFTAFGLDDRFDESLLLFRRALGWRRTHYVRENVTRGRPKKRDLPEATRRLIEQNNALDIELVAFARERFDEVVCAQGPAFRRELAAFRLANAAHGGLRAGADLGRRAARRVVPRPARAFLHALLTWPSGI